MTCVCVNVSAIKSTGHRVPFSFPAIADTVYFTRFRYVPFFLSLSLTKALRSPFYIHIYTLTLNTPQSKTRPWAWRTLPSPLSSPLIGALCDT